MKFLAKPLTWFMALLVVAFATGCGNSNNTPILGSGGAQSSTKAISTFSLAGVSGTINEPAKTIALTVPFGTPLTAAATFTITGVSLKVGATVQTTAVTTNNFTSPVVYTVTAADTTTVNYTVVVTVAPNTAKALTSFSFVGLPGATGTINESAKTVAVTVPNLTNVSALVATFATTGNNVKVGGTTQTSGTTPNNFSSPVAYTVTAANTTTAIYTVTVTFAGSTAKALTAFSFAGFPGSAGTINEPAKTVAVTVPFGTNVTALVATFATTGYNVKVGTTTQTSASTANNFTAPVAYIVTAQNGSTATYTVTVTVAPNPAKALTAFSFAGYTGASGTINEVAKTVAVTVPFGTDVTTLVATFTSTGPVVKVGTVVQTSTATPNNFNTPRAYIVTAADATTATYTVTVTVAANPAKALTAFSFAGYLGATGTINEGAKTIAVTVPFGTDVTTLVATFTSTGPVVKVGTAVQTSTATANDFTAPVVYTVTAADASTVDYTVTVTVAANTAKALTAFSFAGYTGATGVITEPAHTIAVTVPNGTNVTALVATFATTGASVKVGAAVQTSATTANNFTSPVAYIVTAADASTATYTVTVTVAAVTTVLPGVAGTPGASLTNPTVIASSPSDGDTNVPTSTNNTGNVQTVKLVTATFNEAMDPTTITPLGVFTLMDNTLGSDVPGTVTMDVTNTIATFTATAIALNPNTSYTATVTTAARSASTGSNLPMPNPVAWSFTTTTNPFLGQAPVNLLSADNFVILAKTTITDVPSSAITGNIGVSPAAGSFIGVTCPEMTGTIYTVDATYVGSGDVTCVAPGPGANKTLVDNAILDMGTAYGDAMGRSLPDATELGAGDISGLTITPGLYKWSTGVLINTDVTLDAQGDTHAVWIFQISGDLTVAAGATVPAGIKVLLAGGAKAANIFWQVGGLTGATLNTYSTFNGNVLSAKQAIVKTGAVVNGRLFADSQVTLEQNPVTQPAP
ncbi:MAG: ice-binding family protein [Sideroxyarcus sp.]|nr:ice-binding family protein [Sideroxyarcus sp.]